VLEELKQRVEEKHLMVTSIRNEIGKVIVGQRDLIDGLLRLCDSPDEVTGPLNLGNPVEITILELAETVNQLTGNPAGIEYIQDGRAPADPQRRQPEISRAKELLGWQPTTDLETGLRKTIDDFRSRYRHLE